MVTPTLVENNWNTSKLRTMQLEFLKVDFIRDFSTKLGKVKKKGLPCWSPPVSIYAPINRVHKQGPKKREKIIRILRFVFFYCHDLLPTRYFHTDAAFWKKISSLSFQSSTNISLWYGQLLDIIHLLQYLSHFTTCFPGYGFQVRRKEKGMLILDIWGIHLVSFFLYGI